MRRTILVTLLSLLALPAWGPSWAEDIGSVGFTSTSIDAITRVIAMAPRIPRTMPAALRRRP